MQENEALALLFALFAAALAGLLIVAQHPSYAITTPKETGPLSSLADRPQLDASESIVLPLSMLIVRGEQAGPYASRRSLENVEEVLEQVNRIWSQAGIHFRADIREQEVEQALVQRALGGDVSARTELQGLAGGVPAVFFVGTLTANGIALSSHGLAFVNDVTSVNDYRAASHELGHLLGLEHTFDSPSRLMYQGVNGERLVETEISQAQKNTQLYSGQ